MYVHMEVSTLYTQCAYKVHIVTFNVRILTRIHHLPELTASATEHNIDIVCTQEHRYYHSKLEIKYHDTGNGWRFFTVLAWKNSVNAVIGSLGILLSPRIQNSQNSIEKIQSRMMCASFNDNPCTINLLLQSYQYQWWNRHHHILQRVIFQHNVLIIGGDMNAQLGKDENNKFYLHQSSNRSREYLTDFSLENRLTYLICKL